MSLIINIYYKGENGNARKFAEEMVSSGIVDRVRKEEGKDAVSLTPGMVITIPANVKHWHGAKKDSWFSHIAVEVPGENTSTEWCEPVENEYNEL